jgi:hypothetical protein
LSRSRFSSASKKSRFQLLTPTAAPSWAATNSSTATVRPQARSRLSPRQKREATRKNWRRRERRNPEACDFMRRPPEPICYAQRERAIAKRQVSRHTENASIRRGFRRMKEPCVIVSSSNHRNHRSPSCLACPLRLMPAFKDKSDEEIRFIQGMKLDHRQLPAGSDIIHPGQEDAELYTLFSGWAFRYKSLPDGRRQILNFLLPGDLVGLQASLLSAAQHGIEALTEVELCVFPRRRTYDCSDGCRRSPTSSPGSARARRA